MEEPALRAALRAVALVVLCVFAAHTLRMFLGASHLPTPSNVSVEELPAKAWRLAVETEGEQPLRVETSVRRGELAFRFEATLDASVAEIISLARETDLMPTWNPFCARAGVAKVASPLDLFAYADFVFPHLPVPPLFVVVHATLEDRRPATGQHWYCRVASSPPSGDSPDALDRTDFPAEMLKHGEVKLAYAFGTLTALARKRGSPPRSRANVEMAMDLTQLEVLGPLRFLTPPAWLVNTVTRVMIPGVWRGIIDAIAQIQADGPKGPIGARLAADTTGVYRRVRRASGQPT